MQLPRTVEGPRTGPLIRLAAAGQHLAFDLILLYLNLQPITTDGDVLKNGEWARLMSAGERSRKAPAISRAWKVLEEQSLISRSDGRPVLLREDGQGEDWAHPGRVRDEIGYFSIPRTYWLRGYCDALTLPGKAMLMILLAETNEPDGNNRPATVTLSHARFAQYFGLSESTVKRGLQDLRRADLLGERWEKQPNARSVVGYRQVGHYWLQNPFSTKAREKAREIDATEREARAPGVYNGDGDG